MKKWNIDMAYGLSISVSGIEAETRDEAIEKAKELVEKEVDINTLDEHVDAGSLEYDQCTFIKEA